MHSYDRDKHLRLFFVLFVDFNVNGHLNKLLFTHFHLIRCLHSLCFVYVIKPLKATSSLFLFGLNISIIDHLVLNELHVTTNNEYRLITY